MHIHHRRDYDEQKALVAVKHHYQAVVCRRAANVATAPGIRGRGGIQRVKVQKFKCCN